MQIIKIIVYNILLLFNNFCYGNHTRSIPKSKQETD